MRKILMLIFCLASLPFYAQQFSIGAILSPDYCYRTLIDNSNGDASVPGLINARNDIEIPKTGLTSGVNFRYQITELFSVESGIQYSNKGYKTTTTNLSFNAVDPNDPAIPTEAYFVYNMHHIDVPVLATFSIGNKTLKFCASAGLSANIFLKETQGNHMIYSNGSNRSTSINVSDTFQPLNFSALFGVGMEWQINETMSLKVQPMGRLGLSKIIDAPVSAYLNSMGLNMGFYIGL